MESNDIIPIIGSGTVGSYLGYLLAKRGYDVTLYEDHDKIGIPCHCTGIVTSSLLDILDISKLKPELIVNRLKRVKVVAPDNSYTILKSTDIVLDRVGFDVFLAEKAVDEGAKLEYNHKFVNFDAQKKELTLKNKNNIKTLAANRVVAADGPNSALFSYVNPTLKREPWIGVQVVIKGIKGEFDREMYEAYLGSEFAPGFFAWVVPESEESAIIGLATREKTNFYFEKFMKQRCGDDWKTRVQSYRGGLIPLYNKKVICEKQGVFLVGDAAGHVKATSIDWEEAILIKEDGMIKNVRIGEYVDKIKKNSINYLVNKKNRLTITNEFRERFALTPSKNSVDTRFVNINRYISHNIRNKIYEIVTKNGFRIKATGSHSIITLSRLRLIEKNVSELKVNQDYLLINKNIPNDIDIKKINLLEYILRESPLLTKNIRIIGGKKTIYNSVREVDEKKRSSYWYNDSIPLQKFIEKKILPKYVYLVYEPTGKSIRIPNIIKISNEFCRLLGYYTAEGSCKKGKGICLTLGIKDKKNKLIEDILFCIKHSLSIRTQKIKNKYNPSTKKISAYSLNFGGALLSKIFTDVFYTGTLAINKQIPYLIFNVSRKNKIDFLKGYIRGDGTIRIRVPKYRRRWNAEISVKTASRKLASDIIILSFQLGLTPFIETFITKEWLLYGKKIRKSCGYKITYSKKYDLYVLKDVFPERKKELENYLTCLREKESLFMPKELISKELVENIKREMRAEFGKAFRNYKSFAYKRLESVFSKSSIVNKNILKEIEFLSNIIKNKIVPVKITNLKKVKATNNRVYDLEIPETNMFIGGLGPIILHNTGGGIIPGMKAAQALADSFATGRSYDALWRKYTGKDLWMHLKIRHIMNKFSDADYNYLIALMKKEKPKNLMEKSDREYPSKFLLKMLAAEPRFLYFMKHLF